VSELYGKSYPHVLQITSSGFLAVSWFDYERNNLLIPNF
jgi:hypothetical protein